MPFTLGIDTSNYTTSAAVYNIDSGEVVQAKKLLEVKAGERGLRQSEALFQHTKQLPEIIRKVCSSIDGEIVAVGVSSKPFWQGSARQALRLLCLKSRCIVFHISKGTLRRLFIRLKGKSF